MKYQYMSKDAFRKWGNKTFTWMPDEEQNFGNLSPEQKEFWKNNWFTYTLNSYGFRCNDFSTYKHNPTLAVLGCSHTFGIGLPIEKTWGWIVAQNLGLQLVNLGVPGGSMDTCSRIAKFWLPHIQPKIILLQIPELFRREYYHKWGFGMKGVWDKDFTKFALDNWNEQEDKFNFEKNLDLINYYSSCKVVSFNFHKIIEGTFLEQDEYLLARDGRHWGIETHQCLAEKILNIIQ